MLLKRPSDTTLLLLVIIFLALNHSLALSELPNDISVNCGSFGNFNGRKWVGDIGSKLRVISQESESKSVRSNLAHLPDFVPYTTARISTKQFSYVFEVGSGQKFIRLYFYPTTYTGFENFNDLFTAKAGPFTLLSNFSASLTADALGVKYFMKEFCVNVEENQLLTITFSPSKDKAYAFVNGIEIISMPPGLYYTPVGEPAMRVVGKKYQFSVDESIALEMVHRLNVGGSSISSVEDTGLSREWSGDSTYFVNYDFQPISTPIRIKYRSIPSYTAPQKVYQTTWAAISTKQADKDYSFTWKLPVDLGFRYLIRFHFCELGYEIEESSRLRFSILINDQVAEANADLIKWSGGSGIAMFKDYVAVMEGDRMEGKQDMLICLKPKWSDNDVWWTETTDTILKGLEVFKLSNTDNNLAGVNPVPKTQVLSSSMRNPRKFVYAQGGNLISTITIILISLACIIVYQLRILGEQYGDNIISTSPSEGLSRRFSLTEVRSATNNFDSLLVLGRGGFGFVYKGVIDCGTITVAVKRLNSKSMQGAEEFWTEIDMLSKLRHTHLVSLIGYCDEGGEMILVYEYMEHGTLADHLYKIRGGTNFHLSWEQKLKICVGAARGLDYLHTGTRHGVIHRDVKTTNILLDKNLVAKLSDFGLCKVGATSHSRSHISTNVKGTFGYLDPNYYITRRLTKKSDVYAFGVVLLEVLCGRPAVDMSQSEDRHSLALWAKRCIREGKFDELIGPGLQDQISFHCLKVFTEVAYKCLHNSLNRRPTMSDVVVSLEGALVSQNHNRELSSEQIEQEEEANDNESESDYMSSTVQLSGPIPSPTTPVQEYENMPQNKKRSMGKLIKAFYWRLGSFSNRKKVKNYDSSSFLPYRCFSIKKILKATNNFDSNLRLGQDFYTTTYKGWIDHKTLKVAIKCTKPSNAEELLTRFDIQVHSQPRHLNIITLLGYCAQKDKLILVYSYMVNKSLDYHIYGERSAHSPLPWAKRLEICVGAAKGLQYLHYGTTQRIIHRNIKPSNILLDENWVAKISNFGLSKMTVSDHVSTVICGTMEYMDPEYMCHGQVTEKTDVYAFGMVLLVVVCARRPFEEFIINKEQYSLLHWFRTCLQHKKIDQMIDPYLIGRISPECLMQYLKVAWDCLLDQGTKRPTMNSVVESLQIALQLQQTWYIDAGIDTSSDDWIPSVDGRAYNDVLASHYSSFFNDSSIYEQDTIPSLLIWPSLDRDVSFTSDIANDPYYG